MGTLFLIPPVSVGPHSDVCQGPLPLSLHRWVPVIVGLSWQCLSSLSLADQALSWTSQPLSTVLAEVCTGGLSVSHDDKRLSVSHDDKPVQLSFSEYVLAFIFQVLPRLLHLLPCPSLMCFFAISLVSTLLSCELYCCCWLKRWL